jgi:polyhydroxyalkanoate synthesis regulator protein
VIAEQEQFGEPMLSTPLLESIIRLYGNALQAFMSRHLEQSVEQFLNGKDSRAEGKPGRSATEIGKER